MAVEAKEFGLARLTGDVGSIAVGGTSLLFEQKLIDGFAFVYVAQFDTFGGVEYRIDTKLPRNALVDTFDVVVTAGRATATLANVVAQVRVGPSGNPVIGSKGVTAVVDFGTPRTVSAVKVPSGYQIVAVKTWNGAQFLTPAAYSASAASSGTPPHNLIVTPANPASSAERAVLAGEPRTERLQIDIAGASDAGPLVAGLSLVLPDAPGDLEVRIDGGAPAWVSPGPVAPGEAAKRSDTAWNKDAERIVHLAPAFAALTADPTASDETAFELKLTSRAPGLLKLEQDKVAFRRIRRAVFDGRSTTTIAFDEEGEVGLGLASPGLPAEAEVSEVRFTFEGSFAPERTLPPVGPAPFATVDLMLDQERAVLFRLADHGLAELSGLRLPLAPGDDGAEVRIVLWSNAGAAPGAPMDGATSEPLVLDPASDALALFRTFSFATPVPLNPDTLPFAAILVTRGKARLELTQSTGAANPIDAQTIRLGPHPGPWGRPPAGLRTGAFAAIRARARLIGTAPKQVPIAPVSVSVSGGSGGPVDLSPGRKAATVTIPAGAGGKAELRFIARGPGTLTLRDVDIVSVV